MTETVNNVVRPERNLPAEKILELTVLKCYSRVQLNPAVRRVKATRDSRFTHDG